jgi:transposase
MLEVVWPTPAPPSVFRADGRAVTAPTERLHRRAQARHERIKAWRLSPGVEARQALRGVPLTGAIPRIAARGVLTRVANPRPRMNDLGPAPSTSARASADARAASGRPGISPVRRALVARAWVSRNPANVSRHLPRRLERLPLQLSPVIFSSQALGEFYNQTAPDSGHKKCRAFSHTSGHAAHSQGD